MVLGHSREVLLVELLSSQPLSSKIQKQRKRSIDHKAGSGVRIMLCAKTYRSKRTRAKQNEKR